MAANSIPLWDHPRTLRAANDACYPAARAPRSRGGHTARLYGPTHETRERGLEMMGVAPSRDLLELGLTELAQGGHRQLVKVPAQHVLQIVVILTIEANTPVWQSGRFPPM